METLREVTDRTYGRAVEWTCERNDLRIRAHVSRREYVQAAADDHAARCDATSPLDRPRPIGVKR